MMQVCRFSKCPNLRFPEFEGEWEEKMLGEVCDEFKSGNFIKADTILTEGKYPVYGGNGLRGYTNTYNREGQYILIGRQGAQCGNINWILGTFYATEHAIAVITNKENNTFFLGYLLDKMRLGRLSDQSAQPGLAVNKLVKIKVILPSIVEQNKIVDLISLIDQRINTQIKIIEELESLKKGLQKKMLLPTENSEPSLRLSGYKNKWTKIRLGEICSFYSGGTPNSSMKDLYQGNIPFIRSGEIQKYETELHINKKTLSVSSTKLVSKGDLLLALYGATSGEIAISKISGAINQAILCIRTRYNKLFLKYLWESNVSKILKTYLQGGQGNLSGHIVQNVSFFFPALEEQNQIASFIKYIDDKILLEEKQVEEYRKQKNFLLQNLFI